MSLSPLLARRLVALLALATLPLALGATVPASAAPAAPQGLSPSSESADGIPVLSWNPVSGATSYKVQVSNGSDFASTSYSATTTNRRLVPPVQLPPGEVWWRVQSVSSSGSSDWSTTSFDRSALAGPTLTAPADGATLQQPNDPALLSWNPVQGATGYTVEIDTGTDFIDPTTYTTKTPSYVVPNPQVATTYYWRVRATLANGVVTDYSESPWSYTISGLTKPILTSPSDSPLTTEEDVVLDWEPVHGAATYDLQISTDQNFNTVDLSRTAIKGTRFSPPETLENDQYYWRVRPVDSLGNQLDWSQVDTWQFRRAWPDQPRLEYPVDNAVVGDPFYYQWAPAREHDAMGDDAEQAGKASRYQVQLSTTADFSSLVGSCTTVHTTYVPTGADACQPDSAGTYYWRVIGLDTYDGGAVEESVALQADVQRFSYDPAMVDPSAMAPADGSTVQVPTLSWDPVPGAAQYKVFITAVDGGSNSVNGAVTAATTYTPRKLLTPGKTYRWSVQTISGSGRLGAGVVAEDQPRFTVAAMDAATASTPEQLTPADDATTGRMPGMTWQAVAGASYYKIGFRPADSIQAFTQLNDQFSYPAGEDAGTTHLAPGSYEWVVSAYDADGVKLSTSTQPRVLVVTSLGQVTHPRVALTGAASGSDGSSCTAVLPDRCEDLRQTPLLRWDPVPGAGGYLVYLSRDREMTNIVHSSPHLYPVFVDQNMFMPRDALFDSQAGDAFFWEVQPCKTKTSCTAITLAPWAFNKRSNPVELVSPADGAQVQNDVTFDWRDYLETNSDPAEGHTDSTGIATGLAADRYRIEVSTVPNFQTLLDSAEVDQTTYTAFTKAYPEGTLYWRVSAIDATGNRLTSSAVRTFTKASPIPTLDSPTDNEVVSQTEAFRWLPLDFAASYDIEVYKNGDTIGQSANKVFSGNSKQVAFTTTSPLPASDAPYTWRIRRVDASNNRGAWTSLADPAARFRVVGTAPTLVAPTAGGSVGGSSALFSWSAVTGATSYRFERRVVGSTSLSETITTPALAWAPLKTIADGSYEWRVSTLDAAGKVMRSSEWRRFTVDGTPPTVTTKSPTGKVSRGANFVVQFSEPVIGVSTTTMRIVLKGRTDALPAVVTVDQGGRRATLNPSANLKSGKVYRISLTSGITDKGGNPLAPTGWKVTAK